MSRYFSGIGVLGLGTYNTDGSSFYSAKGISPLRLPFAHLNEISRYFITLDPVLQSYYKLSKPIITSSNYLIEFDVAVNSLGTNQYLCDGLEGGARGYIHIDSIGNIGTNLGSVNTGIAELGKIYSVSIEGGTAGLEIYDLFRRYSNTEHLDGTGLCFKYTDLSDPDNPTSQTYKFGEATANYELPKENVFGAEMWTHPIIVDGSVSQYGSLGGKASNAGLNLNTSYLVRVSYSNIVGNFRMRLGSSSVLLSGSGSREYIVFVDDSLDRLYLQDGVGGTTADSIDVSVRETTNAIECINIPTSNRELMTYSEKDKSWLGSELSSIIDHTFTGNEQLGTIDSQVAPLVTDYNYLWEYTLTVEVPVSGLFRFSVGTPVSGGDQGNTGVYKGIHTMTTGTALTTQLLNSNITAGSSYSNISVKRIIQEA